jgi:DNA-binding transcriptional ArsR family regulator
MLTEADRALRAASIALTGDTTDVSITELPEEIVAVSTKRIKNSTKHSSATKASNKKRGASLSRQAVASLYAAFLEISRRDGKMPGWKRVSDRGQQILKRDPHLKKEAPNLTKARTQKWIRVFQSLEPEMLSRHTSEDILKLYDLPVK